MNAATGTRIDPDAHLAQSVGLILTTPIGTRPMRRDFGSLLLELLDAPMGPLGQVRVFAAVAVALARWEPRLRLRRVALAPGERAGQFVLDLEGERTDRPGPSTLTRLKVPLATRAGLTLAT